jgi:hypothetical protein
LQDLRHIFSKAWKTRRASFPTSGKPACAGIKRRSRRADKFIYRSTRGLVFDAGHFQQRTAESRFEALVAMDRNGEDAAFPRFGINVMTPPNPTKPPALLFNQARNSLPE